MAKEKAAAPVQRGAVVKKAAPKAAAATEEAGTGGVIDNSKYKYEKREEKTAGGRPSTDNGDPIAAALRGKTPDEVIELVRANGAEPNPKWSELNPGMVRMNAGNVLRGIYRKTGQIKVGKVVVKNPDYVAPSKAA